MTEKKDASTYNFEHKRQALVAYMRVKMDEGDWHAVSDAANDLRVLEATAEGKKFLVQAGVRFREETINGQPYTVVERA